MPDLSQKFQELFFKSDILQNRPQQIQQQPFVKSIPINQKENLQDTQYQSMMYPEKIGQKRREKRISEEEEWKNFLKSLDEDEINNLIILKNKERILLTKNQLIACGESGEDLKIDRLEKAKLIKREVIPGEGLYEFRITSKGRQVLNNLGNL